MLKRLDCEKDPEKTEVKHIFHQECIAKWFEKKKECPLCRSNFEKDIRKMVRQREGIPEESFEEEKEPQPIQRIPRINVLSRQ